MNRKNVFDSILKPLQKTVAVEVEVIKSPVVVFGTLFMIIFFIFAFPQIQKALNLGENESFWVMMVFIVVCVSIICLIDFKRSKKKKLQKR
ncbi:MAG: hypothetical protein KAS07_01445 [Candidatus Pacebacteria bacterium]|nr:hypothetical protein [Candidatus Paceibacterota bacterium]